jgi:hypothetical protein
MLTNFPFIQALVSEFAASINKYTSIKAEQAQASVSGGQDKLIEIPLAFLMGYTLLTMKSIDNRR